MPNESSTAADDQGFIMPAEWERHEATWLAWPHDRDTFPALEAVEKSFAEIVRALASSERVEMLVATSEIRQRAETVLRDNGGEPPAVNFRLQPYADVWIRDWGPIFVIDRQKRQVAATKWRFNAWGNKYSELLADNEVFSPAYSLLPTPVSEIDMVLEGGSIDVNGQGLLLTTEQCLLNPNRNLAMARADIEARLRHVLGVKKIIWLKSGITGDDTDGHVDDVARFVNATTVVCCLEDDPDDENFQILKTNYKLLNDAQDEQGRPLKVIALPTPGKIMAPGGARLPASYANFYIANAAVLVPIFNQPNDIIALKILQDLFPDRKVIGIPCRDFVHGLGTIHCASQQQPAAQTGER